MDDLISRQAAIDRINKQREHLQPDVYPQDKIGDMAYRICAEFIGRLPSAEPEVLACGEGELIAEPERTGRWIPCSERLPENKTYVLTTIHVPGRQPHARSGWYEDGLFMNDNGDTWKSTDREVKAWMPLPEPYKGDTECQK